MTRPRRSSTPSTTASGVESLAAGFSDDVALAVETDVSDVVPLLCDGAFRQS
jgi:phosphosulfolactate phosphohydrolase-like enzyme